VPPNPEDDALFHQLLEPGHPGMAAIFGARALSPEGQAAKAKYWLSARNDWPGLCRYRAANAALTTRPVAVLMGDSITDNWIKADPAFFAANNFVDRGISGQTSSQMLLRFSDDVLDLHPEVVQILAGTNDIAGNNGPLTGQDFKNNIMAMVDLARAHHIRVVIGAIPPSVADWWAPEIRPSQMTQELNVWLKTYAAKNKLAFVDYYSALAMPDGSFSERYSNDGVHPNRDGYAVMSQMALKAITQTRQSVRHKHRHARQHPAPLKS
jgi:lysophospholipase L1-like esterase